MITSLSSIVAAAVGARLNISAHESVQGEIFSVDCRAIIIMDGYHKCLMHWSDSPIKVNLSIQTMLHPMLAKADQRLIPMIKC